MRRLIGLIMLFFSGHVFGQQDYFVFIQEPTKQPFYVRVGEESFSSSASGHLVMAPVKDSAYSLYVGFPKNKYPEQLFMVDVKGDMGFELKHIDGGWQLFDLEALRLIKPMRNSSRDTGVKRTDSYSMLLAGVVNDTSVLYTTTMKEPDSVAQAPAPVQPVAQAPVQSQEMVTPPRPDTPEVAKAEPQAAETVEEKENVAAKGANKAPDSVKKMDAMIVIRGDAGRQELPAVARDNGGAQQQAVKRDSRDIIRYETINVSQGKRITYLDRTGPVTDTIRIIVPRL